MNKVNFGTAIEAVKEGKLIAREGWNGKGMFVFQRPEVELDRSMIIEQVQSLPKAVKNYYKHQEDHDFTTPVVCLVKFSAYLCMKTADGTIVNGWLASQTDILAEDWLILD